MQEYTFKVREALPIRLDIYLVERFTENGLTFSRAFIQRLIRQGNVSVDGNVIKPNRKIKKNQFIRVVIPPKPDQDLQAENIPLEIIYEDEDLLVINKPRGLVVHPAAGNITGTLVNALLFHCKDLSNINPDRPGIVHRLDKDTAGLLLVAKNNPAYLSLAKQFAEHSIKRIYTAFVSGRVEFDQGVIELPLGRHPVNREKMAVNFKEKGRHALTHYRVIRRYRAQPISNTLSSKASKEFTFVELIPQTGRTHQLRVHMQALGHPILGDATYGRKNKSIKLALYAKYLGFKHPRSGKFMEFEHPLPFDMQNILDKTQPIPQK